MSAAQQQEEQDAWFSRSDRFDGFDRGDTKHDNEHAIDNEAADAHMQPKCYLSKSTHDGETRYRVIDGAMPVSADKPTVSEALAAARQLRCRWDCSLIWNGDAGEFQAIQLPKD